MINIFLNDFEKKLVLDSLKDFNIINFKLSVDGNHAHYIFFFNCGEYIFSSSILYLGDISLNEKASVSEFISRAKEQIKNTYENISEYFVKSFRSSVNSNLAQFLFVHIYNLHYNCYYCGIIDNLSLNTKEMFSFRDVCFDKLDNGMSVFEIYNEHVCEHYISKISLEDKILSLID